jgi:hypothetical protein
MGTEPDGSISSVVELNTSQSRKNIYLYERAREGTKNSKWSIVSALSYPLRKNIHYDFVIQIFFSPRLLFLLKLHVISMQYSYSRKQGIPFLLFGLSL